MQSSETGSQDQGKPLAEPRGPNKYNRPGTKLLISGLGPHLRSVWDLAHRRSFTEETIAINYEWVKI